MIFLIMAMLSSPSFSKPHHFGFDADLEGWEDLFMLDRVDWSPSLGVPPGSLSVTGTFAKSPCLPMQIEGSWHIQALTYNDGATGCLITAEGFQDASCLTGTASTTDRGSTMSNQVWENISFDFPLTALGPYFQIELAPQGPTGTCYFDNVSASPMNVTAVPTQSQYGLMLLASMLGVAAIFLMRRMHS